MVEPQLEHLVAMRVSVEDLHRLLEENARLSKKVDELQARGTEMTQERQRWRDPARIKELAHKAASILAVDDDDKFIEHCMRELVEAS
jgi:hypothetical protein